MDYIMLKNHLEIDISFPHNIRRLSEELATIPARNGRSQPRWRRDSRATELSVPAARVAGHTEVKAGLLGVIRSINRNKKNGEKMKPPLVFWFLSMFFCVFCFSISLTFWQPVLFAPCRKKVFSVDSYRLGAAAALVPAESSVVGSDVVHIGVWRCWVRLKESKPSLIDALEWLFPWLHLRKPLIRRSWNGVVAMTELCSNFFTSCCDRPFIFSRKMLTEKNKRICHWTI